jgi:hypothetical protein
MVEHKHNMGCGGNCICPKCGEQISHRRGTPCQEERCPKCDTKMLREGSFHHELWDKKRSRKQVQ